MIGLVGSAEEARELAGCDLAHRLRILERGGDPGLCPYIYKMHTRERDGYRVTLEIPMAEL